MKNKLKRRIKANNSSWVAQHLRTTTDNFLFSLIAELLYWNSLKTLRKRQPWWILTVYALNDCAGPEWHVHAMLSLPRYSKEVLPLALSWGFQHCQSLCHHSLVGWNKKGLLEYQNAEFCYRFDAWSNFWVVTFITFSHRIKDYLKWNFGIDKLQPLKQQSSGVYKAHSQCEW